MGLLVILPEGPHPQPVALHWCQKWDCDTSLVSRSSRISGTFLLSEGILAHVCEFTSEANFWVAVDSEFAGSWAHLVQGENVPVVTLLAHHFEVRCFVLYIAQGTNLSCCY